MVAVVADGHTHSHTHAHHTQHVHDFKLLKEKLAFESAHSSIYNLKSKLQIKQLNDADIDVLFVSLRSGTPLQKRRRYDDDDPLRSKKPRVTYHTMRNLGDVVSLPVDSIRIHNNNEKIKKMEEARTKHAASSASSDVCN